MRVFFFLFSALLTFPGLLFAQPPKIFWSHNSLGIVSANLDGSDFKVVISNRILFPNSVAVDSVSQKVYWTDTGKRCIGRSDPDGSNVEILLKRPNGLGNLVLDVTTQKMYWLDYIPKRLMRANMDGSGMEIVYSNVPEAYNEFVLDHIARKLYWYNNHNNSIIRTNLDGSDLAVLYTFPTVYTFLSALRIDVLNQKLFWIQIDLFKETNYLMSKNLDGSDEKVVFSKVYKNFYNQNFCLDPGRKRIYLYDAYEDSNVGHYVSMIDYENTTYLQLTAATPDFNLRDMVFDPRKSALYYLSTTINQMKITFNSNGFSVYSYQVTKEDIVWPDGIAVDQAGGKIYWTDPAIRAVKRANLDGSVIENLLVSPFVNTPRGIALDLKSQKMYWADRGLGAVMRANLNGSDPEIVLNALPLAPLILNPEAITLDLEHQKMYLSCQGQTGFYRAGMDGSNLEQLFKTGASIPDQFALDLKNEKLYWSFIYTGILSTSLDGSQQDTVLKTQCRVDGGMAMDVTNQTIYWVKDSILQRVNLNDGSVTDLTQGLPMLSGYGGYLSWGPNSYSESDISAIPEPVHRKTVVASVFPAVFQDFIRVEPAEATQGSLYFQLSDWTGHVIKTGTLEDTAYIIQNLSGLPPGYYFLHLKSDVGAQTLKLIKVG